MEGIELRPVTADELRPYYRTFNRALGIPATSDEALERMRTVFPFDRSLAAFDRGQTVATAHSWLFEWTVPGGAIVPAAGVTAVSVSATHRRRGLLRQLMTRQLSEAAARGEPAAILLASESVIYGRFGYGLCSTVQDIEIDPRLVRIEREPHAGGGVRILDEADADKVLPTVYDRWRRSRHNAIARSDDWWKAVRADRKPDRSTYAVYESASGEVDGYAQYNVSATWESGGLPGHTLSLAELTTVSDDAYAALWSYLLGVDLVAKVQTHSRPTDDPIRWMLTDPRRMRVTRHADHYWARILDVPRMLSARTYDTPGRIVLDVSDPLLPDVAGRYELEADAEGAATCAATTAEPDVSLGITELGAIYQGGASLHTLVRAGRAAERTAGGIARADRMFATALAPWSNTGF